MGYWLVVFQGSHRCIESMAGMDGLNFDELFTINLVKSSFETTERGQKLYLVEGVAATEDSDHDGETMLTKSMDFSPLLQNGWINWDHKNDPAYQIGVPTHGEIRPDHAFFVKGNLLVDDMAKAREVWDLMKACEKNPNLNRRVGWSVQGKAQRYGNLIVKSTVFHLALSHQPINTTTWASFAKSMAATDANGQVLAKENLDGWLSDVWGDCKNAGCYDKSSGLFTGGRQGMFKHLVQCKGHSPKSASTIMKRLIDSTK